MMGEGRYDRECTAARLATEAQGIVLIVMGGKHGHGLSGQVDPAHGFKLPALLRALADEMERDFAQQRYTISRNE